MTLAWSPATLPRHDRHLGAGLRHVAHAAALVALLAFAVLIVLQAAATSAPGTAGCGSGGPPASVEVLPALHAGATAPRC